MGPNDFRCAHRRRLPAHEPPCSPPPAPPRHAPAGQHGPGRAAANGHHSSRQQLGIGRRDRHWAGRDRRTIRHRAERCGHRPPRRRRARPVTHRVPARCHPGRRRRPAQTADARRTLGRARPRPAPHGFTVGNFAAKVPTITGTSDTNTPSAKRAYDLRKLRGNQLVDKPARTRRHRVPAPAARTIAALLTVRDQVIAPILAGIRSPRMGENPRPGPDRPRLRTAPQPTGRPPSTTWPSRPRRR